MNGNPHYQAANTGDMPHMDYPAVQATLTLAYEQRTANLIALEALLQNAGADIEVLEIQNRLGLE